VPRRSAAAASMDLLTLAPTVWLNWPKVLEHGSNHQPTAKIVNAGPLTSGRMQTIDEAFLVWGASSSRARLLASPCREASRSRER